MKLLVLVISALLLFSSCGEDLEISPPLTACESDAISIAQKDKQAEVVQDFGVRIFQEAVRTDLNENTVLSPLSIYSAILLAYEGSACETKKQIMRTLGLGNGNDNVATSTEYIKFMIGLMPTEGDVSFSYANALFFDPNKIQTSESYVTGLEQDYEAEVASLDFAQASAVDAINGWAEENTNGKIKKVLETISGDEIAFLLNAIYYSGEWLNGFIEQNTIDRPFHLKDGSIIELPTMRRDAESNFFKDDNFQIVDMDIKGGEYAVSFLSSSKFEHVDNMLLSADFLDNYQMFLSNLQTGRLALTLPKFELEGKKQLKDILVTMGMSDAFSQSSADLTKMGTAGGNIFLTRVIHDTYIKVDEKGIEGAAVTAIGVGANSIPPSMDFNKAFVFVLRHKTSGVPIFIGKVENPLD